MKVKKPIQQNGPLSTVEKLKDFKNPFQCPGCERILANKDSLRNHFKRVHTDYEKPFKCKKCDKFFHTTNERKQHKKSHKPVEQRKKYICEDCFSVYLSKKKLKEHRSKTCSERLDFEEHNCNLCEQIFATKTILKSHIEGVHEGIRKQTCEICFRGFRDITQVLRHSRHVHTLITDYPCPSCNETYFSSVRVLRSHLTSYHSTDFVRLGNKVKTKIEK